MSEQVPSTAGSAISSAEDRREMGNARAVGAGGVHRPAIIIVRGLRPRTAASQFMQSLSHRFDSPSAPAYTQSNPKYP